jgi:hypothetical protein
MYERYTILTYVWKHSVKYKGSEFKSVGVWQN